MKVDAKVQEDRQSILVTVDDEVNIVIGYRKGMSVHDVYKKVEGAIDLQLLEYDTSIRPSLEFFDNGMTKHRIYAKRNFVPGTRHTAHDLVMFDYMRGAVTLFDHVLLDLPRAFYLRGLLADYVTLMESSVGMVAAYSFVISVEDGAPAQTGGVVHHGKFHRITYGVSNETIVELFELRDTPLIYVCGETPTVKANMLYQVVAVLDAFLARWENT